MTAITDLSDLISLLTDGSSAELLNQYIDARAANAAAAAPVTGRFSSLWQYQKFPMGAGAVPTASAIPDNTTPGGLGQANPGSGKQKFLLGTSMMIGTGAGAVTLYDRLVHNGGMVANVNTAQTTNLPTTALTRYTSGVGNFIFAEIYTQIGTTATTITASYTNQAGTSGRTTKAIAIGGTGLREAQRFLILPLQDGDTGVQEIASITLAATTGTAGNIGVGIGHIITSNSLAIAGSGSIKDLVSGFPTLPEIMTDACLAMFFSAATTAAPTLVSQFSFVEK